VSINYINVNHSRKKWPYHSRSREQTILEERRKQTPAARERGIIRQDPSTFTQASPPISSDGNFKSVTINTEECKDQYEARICSPREIKLS
jgi:hypothetical protein